MGRKPGAVGDRTLSLAPPPLWFDGVLAEVPKTLDRPLAWRLRIDGPEAGRDARNARLAPDEVAAFARTRDASSRMIRRRLAKALVARVAQCHPDTVLIARGVSGCLKIESPAGWWVSLAGQSPLALIGLARSPIGVDIEPADAMVPHDVLSVDECAALTENRLPVLAGWVAKEAHAKACGEARTIDPLAIGLTFDGESLVARSSGAASTIHLDVGGQTVSALAMLRS